MYKFIFHSKEIKMQVIQDILRFLDSKWERPELFGPYHIFALVAMFAVAILLCFLWKKGVIKNPRSVILGTAIIVTVFEIYKQINFNVAYDPELKFLDYAWYAFPWQFCSTPLYVGLLAGLTNENHKIHKYLCSYLATFATFAGLAVMLYPGDVFTETIGICIQTVICHGSMVVVAIFLYYTGYVKTEWKTLFRAIPVFSVTLSVAIILNEIGHAVGLTKDHFFNMFYISRHEDSTLPVYSMVHNALMAENKAFYPLCVIIYVVGFTLVAGIMLLIAMGIKKLGSIDFDAQYAEDDEARRIRREEREKRLLALEEKRREEREKERREKKEKQKEKKEKRQEKQAQKKQKRKERAEEREERRDEKRSEEARERRKRKKERKERKKERKEKERKEEKRIKQARKDKKKREREDDRKIEKRLKEIEKREKKEKKEAKKAKEQQKKLLKKQKKLAKKEEKEYKKWVKKQKKNGTYDPDTDPYRR